ncbi:MAG TPA: cytoplasmic protein [Desulfobacteraceae bacterium]|nr:cytoplasmic protein [Desulfobacteraceae bacterium]
MRQFRTSTNQSISRPASAEMYKDFDATQLYCSRCKKAVPIRKRLLLILPEGEKYEYLCQHCSESVGSKIDRKIKPVSLVV